MMAFMAPRFALASKGDSAEQVERYLPNNYYIAAETPEGFLLAGTDAFGWTMKDFVIPRLQSGSIGVREITAEQALVLGFTPEERVITNEEALFWSNADGWVDLASATRFGRHEIHGLDLPQSAMTKWVDLAEAQKIETYRQSLELA